MTAQYANRDAFNYAKLNQLLHLIAYAQYLIVQSDASIYAIT